MTNVFVLIGDSDSKSLGTLKNNIQTMTIEIPQTNNLNEIECSKNSSDIRKVPLSILDDEQGGILFTPSGILSLDESLFNASQERQRSETDQEFIDAAIGQIQSKIMSTTTQSSNEEFSISDIESSGSGIVVYEKIVETPRKLWIFRIALLCLVFVVVILSLILIR